MNITTMKTKYGRLATLLLLPLTLGLFSLTSVSNEAISTRAFVEQASLKSLATVQSAENALKTTKSQLVSAYAKKIMNDHENIHEEIIDLAEDKNVKIDKKSDTKKAVNDMAVDAGDKNTFDVVYARNQIASLQQTISLFQRAAGSEDYKTRNFASSTLPHLQQHLKMAEQLYAVTAESKTDIFHDRENKVDYSDEDTAPRTPSTENTAP